MCVNKTDRLKVHRLEEGGGVGDAKEKDGWEVGGQHLRLDLPLHHDHHLHHVFPLLQPQGGDGEHGEVLVLKGQLRKIPRDVCQVHNNHLVMNIQDCIC